MKQSQQRARGAVASLAAALALLLTACASSSESAETEPPATAAPTTAAPTTAAPTTVPATTSAPTTTEAPPGSLPPDSAAMLALGEELFQRTAGGIGCQACHGTDALGGAGPNILGKSADTIRVQLESNESMAFIILDAEEIEAIAVYLDFLEQEALGGDSAGQGGGG